MSQRLPHAGCRTTRGLGSTLNLLARLKDYAAVHFPVEQEMMRFFGYTGMDAQQKQHRSFMSQIAELETVLARGS